MLARKQRRRNRIRQRIRKKVSGSSDRPRMSVFRSNKYIYVQLVDDTIGHTLAAASSHDEGIKRDIPKAEQASQVGEKVAEKAKEAGIDKVVFDRGGYLYHGRVKALADGARNGGLEF